MFSVCFEITPQTLYLNQMFTNIYGLNMGSNRAGYPCLVCKFMSIKELDTVSTGLPSTGLPAGLRDSAAGLRIPPMRMRMKMGIFERGTVKRASMVRPAISRRGRVARGTLGTISRREIVRPRKNMPSLFFFR